MDRPLLVMAWLHELLLQRQSQGGLRMPAPILARVYAVSCMMCSQALTLLVYGIPRVCLGVLWLR